MLPQSAPQFTYLANSHGPQRKRSQPGLADNVGQTTKRSEMSMKKTDMDKNMAKKVGGQLSSAGTPQRFGSGSYLAAAKREKPASAAIKTVPISIRLSAELAANLRERAVGQQGGISAVVAMAVEQWLQATTSASTSAKKSAA
jgi:hypothetical protein